MEIVVSVSGKATRFIHDDTSFTQRINSSHSLDIPIRQVIAASFDVQNRILAITYLRRKKKKGPLSLITTNGVVTEAESDNGAKFVESILGSAYQGVKRGRHLKIIVNPFGGVRKGSKIFTKTVKPILCAAGCILDVTYTTHVKHAYEIAQSLSLVYDAIISVSGDGLVHEILNGLANHEDASKALDTPVAPIPTGSGNGLSLNLLGHQDGFDVCAAALNAVKGAPMKVDVFSVLQNGKRSLSYMSQALGLMADVDLGTEHLRWMGDTRFVVGLLQGVIRFKSCPVQLSYKAAEVDKVKMVETLRSRRQATIDNPSPSTPSNEAGSGLPPLQYSTDDTEGWTTFDKPILYVYAGKGPYVGRDLMAFPVSLPNDGFIDIVAQSVSTRGEILKSFPNAHEGKMYWNSSLHYIKAQAYRVKLLSDKGFLSIDGEQFPFQEFQVEVHRELATWLSPYGHYAAEFRLDKAGGK